MVGARPGSPKRWGRTAVQPRAATRRPKSATLGVMPGISAMTTTAGPVPVRYTVHALPSCSKTLEVKSARAGAALIGRRP